MLPQTEIDTFLTTVTDAVDLADERKEADGYEALLAGLHHAKELRDDSEVEWGDELVHRWQLAVDRFAALYRIGRA